MSTSPVILTPLEAEAYYRGVIDSQRASVPLSEELPAHLPMEFYIEGARDGDAHG